jgi:transposase InsO family protein
MSEYVDDRLYKKFGHLQVQLDFLKKTSRRETDNAFIERLWRSVKVEDVHIKPAEGGIELYRCLAAYFNFYNHQSPHQSLKYEPPAVRFERLKSAA